jgi:hypothetical protein
MDTFVSGLRSKVVKTYLSQNPEQRRIWKDLIDRSFGEGYIE